MALGVIQRAMQRGLAKLGEPALLDGVDCGRVAIDRGLQTFASLMDEANDNYTVRSEIATIYSTYPSQVGQLLTHPDGTYRLDKLIDDTGYTRRFTLVRVTPP